MRRRLPQAVYVDRDMWEKIVLNLLVERLQVYVRRARSASRSKVAADGDHAEIRVRDTGTGIPAAELPHVFERFQRIDGARGRSFEGSGIGLALVQELVKLHGGDIRVESEEGRGSVFTVTIPFGRSHLPAGRLDASPAHVSTNVRAQAYLDEAMGWLDGGVGDRAAATPRHRRIWVSISPALQRARTGFCLPTTIRTCATMCGACSARNTRWKPSPTARPRSKRHGGGGRTSCSATS